MSDQDLPHNHEEPTDRVATINEGLIQEKQGTPLNGAEIADIQQLLLPPRGEDGVNYGAGETIALSSSTAHKIWKEYAASIKNGEVFDLSNINLNINDLDFAYTGNHFRYYLGTIQKALEWEGPLLPETPKSNTYNLRNYPQTTYYKGYLKPWKEDYRIVEVEVFDKYTYGGRNRAGEISEKHPVFTMMVGSNYVIQKTDAEGRTINLLDPAVLALQSFLYARENKDDLGRAKELMEIYLEHNGGDLFSLLETARNVCPHKSVHFAKFVMEWVEESNQEAEILKDYFGEQSANAVAIMSEMMDLFDPVSFPYHEFFNHVLKVVKRAKYFVDTGVINKKYSSSILFALFAHDAAVNLADPRSGHEDKGSLMVEDKNPIAAELIKITGLQYDSGEGLIPYMFIKDLREARVDRLVELGMTESEAHKAIYFVGLMDVSNIIAPGQIAESFKVLLEDHGQDIRESKDVQSDYVGRKGGFYVSLYQNVRDFSLSKLIQPDRDFIDIFVPVFNHLNNLSREKVTPNDTLSDLPFLLAIRNHFVESIQEKIDVWEYMQTRSALRMLIKLKYLDVLSSTRDPIRRDRVLIGFNRLIGKIITKSQQAKLGFSEESPEELQDDI
jgi:hypothetical protein